MANPTTQQPEMEDVTMKDASPYVSHQGQGGSKLLNFDAADLSDPARDYIPQGMKKIVPSVGNSLCGINYSPIVSSKEKLKVPLIPGKLPYNRQSFRFSPNPQRQQRSTGPVLPRATEVQSYRMSTTTRTTSTTYAPGILDRDRSVNYGIPAYMQTSSNRKKWNISQASSSTGLQSTTHAPRIQKWNYRLNSIHYTPYGPAIEPSESEKRNANQNPTYPGFERFLPSSGTQNWNTRGESFNTPFGRTARQSQTTSRDSSLSSFDTQKSTDDGKEYSFDSVTSVSTAQSHLPREQPVAGRATDFKSPDSVSIVPSLQPRKGSVDGKPDGLDSLKSAFTATSFQSRNRDVGDRVTDFETLFCNPSQPRKRAIDDEMKNEESQNANTDVRSGSISKYRRVSEDGPCTSIENSETSNADQIPTLAQRTSFSSPSQPALQQTTAATPFGSRSYIASPATPVNDSQNTSITMGTVPGCWPSTPGSMPCRPEPDVATHAEEAIMSGALPPPQSESSQAPSSSRSPATGSPSNNSNESEHTPLTEARQQPPSTWNNYYDTVHDSFRAFQRGMTQTVAIAFSGALAIAGSVTQRALALVRRRRHSQHRGTSPTTTHPPVHANIRALPVEQQRRLRANQWRRDRGHPIMEEYPFPELSFDSPRISPIAEPSIQRGGIDQPNEGFKSTSSVQRTRKHPAHPQILVNNQGSPRNKNPRRGILKVPRVSPELKRRMLLSPNGRDREHGRRVHQLQVAQRTGNFNAFDEDRVKEGISPESSPLNVLQARQQASTRSKPKHKVRFQEPLVTVPENQPANVPELAPHLHHSSPRTGPAKFQSFKTEPSAAIEEEQKENIPPDSAVQQDSIVETEPVTEVSVPKAAVEPAVQVTERVETPDEPDESWVDPWCQPAEFPFGRPVSAVRLFYPTPQPLPPGRTESIYAEEWRKIQKEKKLQEGTERIRPEGAAVCPLSEKWETRVKDAMSLPNNRKIVDTLSGDSLTKRDLATCFTPMAWLNDEVINSYLALIIDYLRRENHNDGRHDKPRYHAFNSFFFSSLRDKGYDAVRRWATRAKIGRQNLLDVDTVFIPVHNSSHWTLIVVKPSDRTIEHFDSLGSLSRRHVGLIKSWLRGELGELYVDEEWKVLPSESPQQDNGSDCGVFLLSTAKAVAINIEPLSYGARDTRLLRRKIVAELMNGGLEGDFAPHSQNGDVFL